MTKTVGYTPHYTFVTKFIPLPNIINSGEQYLMYGNSLLIGSTRLLSFMLVMTYVLYYLIQQCSCYRNIKTNIKMILL